MTLVKNGLGLGGVLGAFVALGVVACGDDFGNSDCRASRTCPTSGGDANGGAGAAENAAGSGAKSSGGSSQGDAGSGAEAGHGGEAMGCTGPEDCDNGDPADGGETCGGDGVCVAGDAPPYVVSVSPDDQAEDIELDASIVLTFSEPIDPLSVISAIQVFDGDAPVIVDIKVQGATVTVTPDMPLELWSNYDVEVSTAVKDAAGIALLEPFSSTFVSRDGEWTTATAVTDTVYDIASSLPISASGQIYAGYLIAGAASEYGAIPTVRRFKDGNGVGAALVTTAPNQESAQARGTIDFAVSTSGSVAFGWATAGSQSYVRVHDETTGNWLPAVQSSGVSSVSDLEFFKIGWHAEGILSVFSKQNYDSFKIFVTLPGQGSPVTTTHSPGAESPFALAFDDMGDGFAVWSQLDAQQRSHIAYSRYLAANEDWGAPVMMPGSRASTAGAAYARSAPTIVMSEDGVAQVAWFRGGGSGASAALVASEFAGGAWSEPRLVSGDTQIELGLAAPALVASGDTFVAAWVADGSESGVHAYTATFDTASKEWGASVEHVGAQSATWDAARIGADARGNLMVVWTTDAGASQRQLVYRRYSGARDEWSDVRDVPEAIFPVATGINGPVHVPLGMNAKGRAGLMWAVQDAGPHWNSVEVASFN